MFSKDLCMHCSHVKTRSCWGNDQAIDLREDHNRCKSVSNWSEVNQCMVFALAEIKVAWRENCKHNITTESCFCHPLFDLQGTRKVKVRHTNFHFSSKKVTSKVEKLKFLTWQLSKNFPLFDLKKQKSKSWKVEKSKSWKVEKYKSRKVEKLKSGR